MAAVGDTKTRFGRSYIYLNPPSSIGDTTGTAGTWRLRVDDTSTPVNPNPGGGGDVDLSVTGTAGETLVAGQLLYLNSNNLLMLASAASTSTSGVVGIARENAAAGAQVSFIRNTVENFYNTGTIVDGSPTNLVPGTSYFLSTTPGGWTVTPDTTTPGAVVMSCGIAVDIAKMSIEIQTATVI